MAINASSKNPERALMAIELLKSNEEINKLTWYGEGEHYTADGDEYYTPTENLQISQQEKYVHGDGIHLSMQWLQLLNQQ